MSNRKGEALTLLSLPVTAVIFIIAITEGIKREEVVDCLKWQRHAKEAPAVFYLTPEQKKQCDALGIAIKAPVRREK